MPSVAAAATRTEESSVKSRTARRASPWTDGTSYGCERLHQWRPDRGSLLLRVPRQRLGLVLGTKESPELLGGLTPGVLVVVLEASHQHRYGAGVAELVQQPEGRLGRLVIRAALDHGHQVLNRSDPVRQQLLDGLSAHGATRWRVSAERPLDSVSEIQGADGLVPVGVPHPRDPLRVRLASLGQPIARRH